MNTQANNGTVRETVISCLEAPRLKGVSTRQFIEFKRLRDLYEKQVEEKSRNLKEDIVPTSLRASIEDDDLNIFIAAGWIDAESIDTITERQILQCIEERCKRVTTGEHLYLVDQAVKNVSMNTNISEAEDRIWSLRRDYYNALRSAGYAHILETKPHIAINHILKKLKPPQLYRRMLDIMTWRKNENFHKENFDRFVREAAAQAEKIQTEHRGTNNHEHNLDNQNRAKGRRTFHAVRKSTGGVEAPVLANRKHSEKQDDDVRGKKRKRDVWEAPLCLNPVCRAKGKRHYISNCEISDKNTKTALVEEYRSAKKARLENAKKGNSTIARISHITSNPHSSVFRASFGEGAIDTTLMADQGADANFMSARLFKEILQKMEKVHEKSLQPPQIYRGITGDPCLTCERAADMDVFLKIRHGSSLILRKINWKITNEDIPSPIIGRRVLESLGCDNREMLMAARDKYGDDIDVADRLATDGNQEENEGTIAALFGESVFHSSGQIEEDGLEDEDVYVDLGDDRIEDIEDELQKRIAEAVSNGLSRKGEKKLEEIIQQNKTVFKIRLGSGGPANVTPMKIVLDETKKPVKVKVRKYPKEQRKFLDTYFSKLVDMGFLKPCPQASWQAAPHLVPKESKSKFRTTIDLRPVNAATKAEQWPMPVIEAELSDFIGSTHFASIDFCSSYWQCPLDPDSYDACGIISPQGTFVSTRVLHGLKNASAYFQSTIPPLFDEMKDAVKAWIDDFTIHCKTEDMLLENLEKFFRICTRHNLRVSAKKTVLYTKRVKWCGRIIDSEGYQLDPRNMEAIQKMEAPINASELCQFVHCCRWMCNSIPNFHQKIQPLNEILEAAYKQAGRRKKSALKNIMLRQLSWGTEHKMALTNIQDSLRNAVKLAFPKDGHVLCVYTDASEEFWAAVITQTKEQQLNKKVGEQQHEPMAFLGGRFTGAQKNWTTYEKEAYAIVQTFDRLDYLFWGTTRTHIFTDHKNLLYVFAPLALRPNSPRHVLSKVHRWAIHLSRFEFFINHIEGSNNIFADILTRWSKGYRTTTAKTSMVAALYKDIAPTSEDLTAVWINEIKLHQARHHSPAETEIDDDGIHKYNQRIWVPSGANDLKLRIAVEAHCGERGHRAYDVTLEVIQRTYWWPEIKEDIKEFIQSCIHCIISRNGERIPRPLSTALHGERPNEVVHADFLYMGPSNIEGLTYVLLIKDDLSSYTWLHPCANADSEAATNAIAKWISCFGCMPWLVTDQGSHFTASLMTNLTREMHIRHHFTTAYCPWANGTIERLCKEVLRVVRALLSEWKMPVTQWPSLVGAVQKVINHSPIKRLGRNRAGNMRCPMEVFTGLTPSPLLVRPMPLKTYRTVRVLDNERVRSIIDIGKLHESLEEMHKDVSKGNTQVRTRAQQIHNARTKVLPLNIYVGDFVMVRVSTKRGHKLETKWKGPMRVVETKSSLLFVVEDINSSHRITAHAQRLVPYPITPTTEQTSKELKQQATYYDMMTQIVDRIKGVRKRKGKYELLVAWMGYEEGDNTWEPIETMLEDIPGVVEDYMYTAGDRNLKREIIDLYF